MDLMMAVWMPAVARVHEEVRDMQAIANKENTGIQIEPWDYRYYAEKVRKEKYDLDANQVKPYLQLEKLREGMFWVAGELFNFSFTPVTNVPVYHPDIRVWEVKDKTTGKHIGLGISIRTAQAGKRSGAWMNAVSDAGKNGQRDHDDRFEQRQFREGKTRRAHPGVVGRCGRHYFTNSGTPFTGFRRT